MSSETCIFNVMLRREGKENCQHCPIIKCALKFTVYQLELVFTLRVLGYKEIIHKLG